MFRVLFFLAVVLLLGLGFTWLAEQSGDLVLTAGGYRYELTLVSAIVLLIAAFLAIMFVWWLLRSIWMTPSTVAGYFRARRRDRGYRALSTGLIAAGAGDGGLARRMGKQASKLISSDHEPLMHLLDAQAALLQGDHEAAQAKFDAMSKHPETRLLGLRGLYLEAQRLGNREAAHHYATETAQIAPQLDWAVDAALEAKSEEHDWQGALKLVEAQKGDQKADREVQARRRAVLLTAQAMEQLDGDQAAARTSALEANRLQPDFVPAAAVAAKALFRQNDLRRGSKVLEAVWKKEPHPEVADIYVHARPGDSAHDRLTRAKMLRRLKPNNVESELAMARAALDAGEFKEAREAAEAAVRIAPREGAFLLLADIEEAETGDQGRVRHWLAKAVRAPRDPAWVADGFVSEQWAPVSPVTGQLDAFEWRVPVERLGQVIEGEDALKALPALEAQESPEEPEEDSLEDATVIEADIADAQKPDAEADQPRPPEDASHAQEEVTETPGAETPKNGKAVQTVRLAKNGEAAGQREAKGEEPEEERPPLPDDPGVEGDDEDKPNGPGHVRLF